MSGAPLVLIVEDNEQNLKLTRDVLVFHGYRTLEARSAGECLSLAQEMKPDLILMDIQLPDQDGVTTLGQLREDASLAHTPVIAVTAFAMKGDEERLMASGFDGYIPKPIDIRSIANEIGAYLVGAEKT